MAYTKTITLQPTAPFSLELSAEIFSAGDMSVRGFRGGIFQQVIDVEGSLVLMQVTSNAKLEQPELMVTLRAASPLKPQIKQGAQDILTYIFNLNFPLNNFYAESQGDAVMRHITHKLRGFKFPTTPTAFESLLDAIVEQQISIKVARTIEERLATKFGAPLTLDGTTHYAFPTAHAIAAADISDIRSVGLSQRKAEYIQNAAQLITAGQLDLEAMKTQPDADQIITKLDALKGIGVWTAELTLLRGMQRWDVLPADDFGLRRVISTYCCEGKPIKADEARAAAQAWGTWKGLAAFYLILAEVHQIRV
ncbi:MAG: DNA-3-methyladenine glycosylase 2 family protein [Candidatus Bathyarchaeota archaeon]|nr:DNA-3-methyladenine glycosylase 2 family protein [Candidatus Bathyarchaeota archaeon]